MDGWLAPADGITTSTFLKGFPGLFPGGLPSFLALTRSCRICSRTLIVGSSSSSSSSDYSSKHAISWVACTSERFSYRLVSCDGVTVAKVLVFPTLGPKPCGYTTPAGIPYPCWVAIMLIEADALMSLDFRGNGNTNSKRDWTS